MTTYLEIPSKYLKAALVCAGKNGRRAVLNAVCVQSCEDALYVVATDGPRMLACKLPAQGTGPVELVIPRADVEAVLRLKMTAVAIAWEPVDDDDGTRRLTLSGSIKTIARIERYPDWHAAVPRSFTGEAGTYNPTYFGDIVKIARALGHSPASVVFCQNGPANPALFGFTSRPEVLGVLCPLRVSPCHGWPAFGVQRSPISKTVIEKAA